MGFKHENTRGVDLKEPKPTILYASEDARNFIQDLGFETEHVFETIKMLALKKGAVKISVNLFNYNEADKNTQSVLKINVCFLNYQF